MKCGIEIHQRISNKKLFCDCEATMRNTPLRKKIRRVLHPVVGETGKVDRAVLYESMRNKQFTYEAHENTACLVDTDSEPPHNVNEEALSTALSIAKHLKMFVPDELHVMRKTVIDGSNTSGFQRTMIIGLGTKKSKIPTSEGSVRIKDLELEEESARIITRNKEGTRYNLSGLGVPLIEIGTQPDIKTPEQAKETALYLGELLRLTGNAQRGIGSIRQDVNISVNGGARVEIKGFQELNDLPRLIEYEVKRQESLIELSKKLTGYELKKVNVTKFFKHSKIFKNKKFIIGLILPGFKGLLAQELNPAKTLGSELADYARSMGVKGLIHEDEDLKKYDLITEFTETRNELGLKKKDLLLIIAGKNEEIINQSIKAVEERVYQLNDGVPEETRTANPDCSSSYARPLPGGARMYPETDVPLIRITRKRLRKIPLIESKEERVKRLKNKGLTDKLVKELLFSPQLDVFDTTKVKLEPIIIARVLVEVPKEVKKRYGVNINSLTDEQFKNILSLLDKKEIVFEAVPLILRDLCKEPELTVNDLLGKYRRLNDKELKKIINQLKKDNPKLSNKQLMGLVMKEVKGRAKGSKINKLLQ